MLKYFTVVLAVLYLSACSSFKVVEVDPKTGYFPSAKKASVVMSKPLDPDARKSLILVPYGDFVQGMVKNIGYFDELITIDELEKKIVAANQGDKVSNVRSLIGISNAAKH
ncbi:MAG: hypothetical protein NUV51_06960 [Sulfuricaulis sp.]|nr:hypothetical protein [Sulfuricaulis sp.]